MNRLKKYELQKHLEKRRKLAAAEIEMLDLAEQQEMEFWESVQKFHFELFPEEWSFVLDSNVELRDRAAGVNPMSKEYIARVGKKRIKLGISPIMENGMPPLSNDSWQYACEKVLEAAQLNLGSGHCKPSE